MSKAPAFQWYPKDCDTDENVRGMDDREFGFYVRCLNHTWLNDGLPSDIAEVARLMGRPVPYVKRVWARVGRCFVVMDGRLYNKKQEQYRAEKCAKASGARDAAAMRWHKIRDAEPMRTHENLDAESMRSHKIRMQNGMHCARQPAEADAVEEETKKPLVADSASETPPKPKKPDFEPFTEGEFDFGAWFDRQYARHPRKGNRGVALNYLTELVFREVQPEEFERVHLLWCACEAWTDGGGKFVKQDLAQWVLDKGWKYPPPNSRPAPAARPNAEAQHKQRMLDKAREMGI